MTLDQTLSPQEIVSRIPATRLLSVEGDLTNAKAQKILADLRQFEAQEYIEELLCVFDSPGGHTQAGLTLYAAFHSSRIRIIGLVRGEAKSAAFIALQGCALRFAGPLATLRVHNPVYWNYEIPIRHDSTEREFLAAQQQFFRQHQPRLRQSREEVISALMERTGMSRGETETFLSEEKLLNPEEAIHLNLLDASVHP